jgi:CheY-like chemotaxis protein
MVVDDERIVRVYLEKMLHRLGYTVTTCEDGAQAVDLYEREWRNIDLVILDMVMPVMTGDEAFLRMQKINPKVSAILSSGYSVARQADRALEAGARAFLPKPYDAGRLARVVADAVAGPQAEDS